MTIEDLEREEQDRIQYEMQLAGQNGKRWGSFSSGKDRLQKPRTGPVRVESSENYILTVEDVTKRRSSSDRIV